MHNYWHNNSGWRPTLGHTLQALPAFPPPPPTWPPFVVNSTAGTAVTAPAVPRTTLAPAPVPVPADIQAHLVLPMDIPASTAAAARPSARWGGYDDIKAWQDWSGVPVRSPPSVLDIITLALIIAIPLLALGCASRLVRRRRQRRTHDADAYAAVRSTKGRGGASPRTGRGMQPDEDIDAVRICTESHFVEQSRS